MDKIYSPEKQKYVKVRSKHGQHILHSYNNHMLHGKKCTDCKFSKIVNIHTNRMVSTYGKIGKNIINQYNKITHLHKGGAGIINSLQQRLTTCEAACRAIKAQITQKEHKAKEIESEFPPWYRNDGQQKLDEFKKDYVDKIVRYNDANICAEGWHSLRSLNIINIKHHTLIPIEKVMKIKEIMQQTHFFNTYFDDYLNNIINYLEVYDGSQLVISRYIYFEIANIQRRQQAMQEMINQRKRTLNNKRTN